MDAAEILTANVDSFADKQNDCTLAPLSTGELKRQRVITQNTKDTLCQSVNGAIEELNSIVGVLSSQANMRDTSYINSMLYNSLVMLIDELDYIAGYIERIENNIDMAVFDIAKKLNESIVQLIGHRKDILFKVIECTYKIHDYIIKWKRIANDTAKLNDSLEPDDVDYIESSN